MNPPRNISEKRQFERLPLMLEAEVSHAERIIECVIFNVSAGGAKVRLKGAGIDAQKSAIKRVLLHIPPFGDFEGDIVWTDDEYMGIKFYETHKTVVNMLLERASSNVA
ncbi:MAG: PilZ domain-containing protein [Proteobacteria bacterium]|nr:PilZ domain-containing protein [Pseudomonadota bacterium]